MNCHFHDLRHTFATRLVQAGVDLYKVQRLLGHKSPMMTQRYAHHYPESLRDGVEILDRRGHRDTKMTTVVRVSRVLSRKLLKRWWAILVSNQWPLPCEGSALPLS